MRITCPICGERDSREFAIRGAALVRPDHGADPNEWDNYLHLRDNPAGQTQEFWHHQSGCGAWLKVTRNTASHAVDGAILMRKAK